MGKRRVYIPGRDEGWSNGRYWKAKEDMSPGVDDYYTAHCQGCEKETVHEYDECIVCGGESLNTKDSALESFGRDIAEH